MGCSELCDKRVGSALKHTPQCPVPCPLGGMSRAGPRLDWRVDVFGCLGYFCEHCLRSGVKGIWEGNPIPVMNKQGYLHLSSTPHPFLVVVVLRVWEAGRVPGKMTRVVLTYWVLGKECGNNTPAPRALAAHPPCCLSSLPSPLHPLAAVWSPHGLWGDVGWG